MKNLNYALLIQGPISSPGRTGTTFFNKALNKDSIVEYNCENNLIKILTDFGHLFKQVYIVTWSNEILNESLFEKFKNCSILKLQNITPNIKIDNKQLPTDFNNKYKQFYAMSKGLELIKDTEFVIKTRTDQYLNLQALIDEHKSSIETNREHIKRIYIPYINKINYLPSDFYFIATTKTLTEFSNAMLWGNYLEFNSSVHIDMSLKYLFLHHKNKLNVSTKTYFLNSFDKNPNQDKVKMKNYLTRNVYKLFSSSILEQTTWRGDPILLNEEAKSKFIFSKTENSLIIDETQYKKTTFTDFLYINIPSYLVVKYPRIRNTVIEFLIKKVHFFLKKLLKK